MRGNRTKKAKAGSKLKARTGTDWSRLGRASAASIRKGIEADSEVHATDTEFWKHASVVMPAPKEIVTMRLDADLLRWFRKERGYQTRINAILRAYVKAHESA